MYFRSIAAVALTALTLLAAGCQAKQGENPGPSEPPVAGPASTAAPSGAPAAATQTRTPGAQTPAAQFSIGRDSYPTTVGAHYFVEWTDIQAGRTIPNRTEDYTIKRAEGDLLEFESTFTAGKTVSRIKYYGILRPEGVYMKLEEPAVETDGQHSTSGASLMFKFPMTPGMSWEYVTSKGTRATRRIVGLDTITVKAGTFKAVCIADEREGGVGTQWFVPNVGVIKHEIMASDGQHIKELTRYVPAK